MLIQTGRFYYWKSEFAQWDQGSGSNGGGIQKIKEIFVSVWIPACAGMTGGMGLINLK
jgi:hypothetical protein